MPKTLLKSFQQLTSRVRRDSKGRILSRGKWSPQEPLEKTLFTETEPLIIEYDTGREALQKVRQVVCVGLEFNPKPKRASLIFYLRLIKNE